MIEAELYKWFSMFYFFLCLPIEPPCLTFFEFYFRREFLGFYARVASTVTNYLVYTLHPSHIVMPLFILLYGLLLYRRFNDPPLQHAQRATFYPIFGRHYAVDCSVALPATYVVFSSIMLLPNYIQYLRNRQRIYEMNTTLLRYSISDMIIYALLFTYVTLLLPLREPPRKFISDGIVVFGVTQSTRLGSLLRRTLKFLLLLLVTCFTKFPLTEFFPIFGPAQSAHHSIRDALGHYRNCIDVWAQKEHEVREAEQQYDLFMAKLEQGASPRVIDFDADAFDMATDNCASKTCTPHLSDLYDFRSVDNATLTGVGTGQVTHIGKAKYVFLDDNGREILVDDHEVLVCPNLPSRILSVPSWANQLEQRHGPHNKTSIKSFGSYSRIKTDQNRLKRTITHHDKKGIPIVRARLAEKDSYSAYSACFPCYTVNFESDDVDTDYQAAVDPPAHRSQRQRNLVSSTPKETSFVTTDAPPSISPDEQQSPQDMLMGYHLRLGHLSFDRLQQAARQGILPRRIADCSVPKCPSCLFGKAKRRPWRTRAQTNHIGRTVTKPGDMVSVDQLISKTPGLIAQSTGKMTHRRHMVATIFVDHASGLDYVHTQESTTGVETVAAKEAFERFAARHHVTVKHYECDNGIFAGATFRAAVQRANQTICFCGVNAHHQNGVAERRIQDLADRSRSMLVNARHHNPFATDNLWPFALQHASAIDRTLPKKANTQSPL
jgi:hypothetical protein